MVLRVEVELHVVVCVPVLMLDAGLSSFCDFTQASPALLDFLDCMIVRDPSKRKTASQLLKHAFLKKCANAASLVELIRGSRRSMGLL